MALPLGPCPDLGATVTTTEESTSNDNVDTSPVPEIELSDHRNSDLGAMEESIQNANVNPLSVTGMDSSNQSSPATGATCNTLSTPITCTDVAQLQALLAKSLQREADLEAKVGSLQTPDQGNNICRFLAVLPRETRDHIYSFVLVSESLSDKFSVHIPSLDQSLWPTDSGLNDEPIIKYGLSPALLRTCRQIHGEASEVLYGKNVFYVDCGSSLRISSPIFRRDSRALQRASDLLFPYEYRRPSRLGYSITHDEIKSVAAVAKVRRWKLFVSLQKPLRHIECPPAGVACLCRAICRSALLSLDIRLIPTGYLFSEENSWNPWGTGPNGTPPIAYNKLNYVLQPLQALRNVQWFAIRPAPADECRTYDTISRRRPPGVANVPAVSPPAPEPVQIPPQLAAKIRSVVQGDSPVIRIFDMLGNLVAYAQAFERNEVYKAEMLPKYGRTEESDSRRYPYYGHPDGSSINERSFFKRARNYQSPDVHVEIHPVEYRLEQASMATDRSQLTDFRKHRKAVIKQLDQQYGRISTAAMAMADLVKLEKRKRGLFGVTKSGRPPHRFTYDLPRTMACFVVALKKYAKSFERELNYDMEVEIQLRSREWKHAYSMLPREQLLRKLDSLMESGTTPSNFPSVPEFVTTFRLAMDDMDKQYLEIRRLRKLLFKDDPDGVAPRWYSDDFFQPWLCDEMINWNVNEPDMSPASDPNTPVLSPREVRRRLRAGRLPYGTPLTLPPLPVLSAAANPGPATATNAEANADANVSSEKDDDVDSIWGDLNDHEEKLVDLSKDPQLTNASSTTLSDASQS
ncbi:uncharacterized protein PAC_15003 [Phialocephala subalpina]|uniref:Uncharacterized protein n=1 Tax=Phialocephala subalpina TaxID=576137 RepID=A0A1L7XJB0_9HELO|nr:uncharacterized protein PAC_15003 [Phialocephala subalpina]